MTTRDTTDARAAFAFDPDEPPAAVRRWIERLDRVLAAAPDTVWLFVMSGTPMLLVKGADGDMLMDRTGGVDQAARIWDFMGKGLAMDGGDA